MKLPDWFPLKFDGKQQNSDESEATSPNFLLAGPLLAYGSPDIRRKLLDADASLVSEEFIRFLLRGYNHYLSRGDLTQARNVLETAQEIWERPGNPAGNYVIHFPIYWCRLYEPDQAEAVCKQIVEQGGLMAAAANCTLGWIYYRKEMVEEALACWESAWPFIQSEAEELLSYCATGLCLAYMENGDFNKALSFLMPIAAKYNMIPVADAAAYLLCALAGKANHQELASGYHQMAEGLFVARHFEEAVYCYRRAIELDPALSDAYRNLGDTFFRQGRLMDAIEWFQKAIDLNPKDAPAYRYMGHTFAILGKYNEALNATKKAVEIDPYYENAKKQLEWLEKMRIPLDENSPCSPERALHVNGIEEEYKYVRRLQCSCGSETTTLEVTQQALMGPLEHPMDVLSVRCPACGLTAELYFDISSFFGKGLL